MELSPGEAWLGHFIVVRPRTCWHPSTSFAIKKNRHNHPHMSFIYKNARKGSLFIQHLVTTVSAGILCVKCPAERLAHTGLWVCVPITGFRRDLQIRVSYDLEATLKVMAKGSVCSTGPLSWP